MSHFVVGLTGGIGSGKSFVAELFAEHGVSIIDADVIAREVVAPNQPAYHKIVAYFGPQALDAEHRLNREYLRQQVFTHAPHKTWLNHLLHPLIRQQMLIQCQAASSAYCILVIPLLVENQLQALANRVLVIDVPETLQRQRAAQRDQNSQEQIAKIMAAQVDRQTRVSAADDIIDNSGELAVLRQRVANLHQEYLDMAKTQAKA